MAINITDSGASIKVEFTAIYTYLGTTYPPQIEYIDKSEMQVSANGDAVLFSDKSKNFKVLFSDITSPSGGDAATVAAAIEAFKDASDTNTYLISINNALTESPVNVNSEGLVNDMLIKDGAGVLISILAYNDSEQDKWLQIFNSNSYPGDGSKPVVSVPCASKKSCSYGGGFFKRAFDSGIYAIMSTNGYASVISTDSQSMFDAQIKP